MNTKKRILTLLLVIAMMGSSVSYALPGGLPGIPGLGGASKKETAEDKLKKKAAEIGEKFGETRAVSDFSQGLKADSSRHFKNKKEFLKKFSLDSTTSFDTDLFYDEFKESFHAAYLSTYFELVIASKPYNEVEWYKLAREFAQIDAKVAGVDDQLSERRPNAALALQRVQSDEQFATRFSLNMFDENVNKEFLKYYSVEFKKAYAEAYLESIKDYNFLNTNYIPVDSRGALMELVMQSPAVLGFKFEEKDKPKVSLVLNPGTIKRPAMMAIRAKKTEDKEPSSVYTRLTEIYEVALQLTTFSVRFFESPILYFEKLNVEGAGIYEFALGKWQYLYTEFEDEAISTKLDKGLFYGAHYMVLVDNTYVEPKDSGIKYNKFFRDIYVAARRHILPPIAKVRPKDKMTRYEFAEMAYRAVGHLDFEQVSYTTPVDLPKDEYKRNVLEFAAKNGFLTADSKLKINPNAYLNYSDFEKGFRKISKNSYFSVRDLVKEELMTRYYKSDYNKVAAGSIARQEVIYAFVNKLF